MNSTADTLEFMANCVFYSVAVFSFFIVVFGGIEIWWGGNRNLKDL